MNLADGVAFMNADGCIAHAEQQLYGDLTRWLRAQMTVVNLAGEVSRRASDDERAARTLPLWRACMKARGFAYKDPGEARAAAFSAYEGVVGVPGGRPEDLDRVRGREISIAVADADDVSRVGERPRFGEDGRTVFYDVVLDVDPYSSKALDAIGPLKEAARAAADAAGVADATVLIGGETAQNADIRSALDRDTTLVALLVLAVVTAVLVLLLRSLLAPLYLVATLVLSFLATLGATAFFTLTVLGDEGIGNRVTAYVFVFLVALGVDYNIFIMSRFKQELRTLPPAKAISAALTRTGGVVSSAGLILAATFAVLMTQPIRELFQFGFAMAFGILLDTFLVRPLLVPAIVRLLGDHALWPASPARLGTPLSPVDDRPAAPAAEPSVRTRRLLRAFTWSDRGSGVRR
ncbi:MMPL family transporter [Streptomyces sp. NPDC008122]|uniref:MMPL family transporter n=1 Tax=Streptomyces sp. NPDC008122 TaxID=3364810 RepID=UPI0036E72620